VAFFLSPSNALYRIGIFRTWDTNSNIPPNHILQNMYGCSLHLNENVEENDKPKIIGEGGLAATAARDGTTVLEVAAIVQSSNAAVVGGPVLLDAPRVHS
jgi:hypothetical protein